MRDALLCGRRRATGSAGGFTVTEMMVVVVLLGLLVTLAVPPMKSFIDGNKSMAFNRQLESLLQFARANAVSLQRTVSVCQEQDKGVDQLVVRRTGDCNGGRNPDEVLRRMEIPQGITLSTVSKPIRLRFVRNGALSLSAGSGSGLSQDNRVSLVSCMNNDYNNGFTLDVNKVGHIYAWPRGMKAAEGNENSATGDNMTTCSLGDG